MIPKSMSPDFIRLDMFSDQIMLQYKTDNERNRS